MRTPREPGSSKSFPDSKKKAAENDAILVFVDEAKCQLNGNVHRTWGRVGETPKVQGATSPASLNMIGALTSHGEFDLTTVEKTNQKTMAEYLDHLCDRFSDHRLIIVWDNASWHNQSNAIQTFLESEKGQHILEIAYLPVYSPELNPQELVWKTLKHEYLGNHRCGVLAHLRDALDDAFELVCERLEPTSLIEHVRRLFLPADDWDFLRQSSCSD